MKCLQCGTELDRMSKWRGSSEYCSEECKKTHQEEFNRLAMKRLMQPRPARSVARSGVNAVRTVESGSSRLTVVTHPVGASSPIVTEPPEAAFIMEAAATLIELQVRHQAHIMPRAPFPAIPSSDLPMGDALIALEAILAGLRPGMRSWRKWNPVNFTSIVIPARAPLSAPLPSCEPVWPRGIGLDFSVAGIQNPSNVSAVVAGAPDYISGPPATASSQPVVHHSIPSLRPVRPFPTLADPALGVERLLPLPLVSPPRLRIHLPKPALSTFRPRYAFAPRLADEVPPAAEVLPSPATVEIAPQQPRPVVETTVPAQKTNGKRPEPKPAKAAAESKRSGAQPSGKPSKSGIENNRQGAGSELAAVEKKQPESEPIVVPESNNAPALVPPEEPVRISRPAAADPVDLKAPSFGVPAEEETEGFFARMPGWQKALAALVLLGIAVGAWIVPALSNGKPRSSAAPSSAPPAITMGPESWDTESTADTSGVARRRVINRYKPGRGKRDYILEFTGKIEQRAMGWVFRMKDSRNYYCLKLETAGEGASAKAQLVKFAVINGEEQPHRLAELREPLPAGGPVKVRLDVRGHTFSIQVNGKPVDVWIDNQLTDGTVGFSNESGERAVISSVRVSF